MSPDTFVTYVPGRSVYACQKKSPNAAKIMQVTIKNTHSSGVVYFGR